MDIKKKIPKNIFTNKFLKDLQNFINKHYTTNNLLTVLLMIYITIISVYTPRAIIAFVNNSIVKIIILSCIVIFGRNDIILALFMAVALMITINLDNSISLFEKKELFQINEEQSNIVTQEEKESVPDETKTVEKKSSSNSNKLANSEKLVNSKKSANSEKLVNSKKKVNTQPNTCLQPHNKEYVEQNYHLCCQNNHWKKGDRLKTCKAVQGKICSEKMYYGEDDDESIDSESSNSENESDSE